MKHTRWLIPLMTAGLCVLAPWSLPLGPVGLSAATLGVYLIVGLLPFLPGDAVKILAATLLLPMLKKRLKM